MILRKPASPAVASGKVQSTPLTEFSDRQGSWASRTPLRWRLATVTGLVVAVAVALMTLATYWVVSMSLTASVDERLEAKADVLLRQSQDPRFMDNVDQEIKDFKAYNPGTRVALSPPSMSFSYGDTIPVGGDFHRTEDYTETSVRTVGGERVLAKRHDLGSTVVVAQSLAPTQGLIAILGTVLLIIVGLGILLAIFAGLIVSKTGMQPIARLKRAVDYVTQTNDLRPIEVSNNDEMAQLTTSFNQMLEALQESRSQQSQFVADAGHELKTPLTSMRTNIELLMMLNRAGGGFGISDEDRKDLEDDVMSQMNELSTLIGDLVDLAREDGNEREPEPVDLCEVMMASLERARRRRPDVEFLVRFIPWELDGDPFALGRATLNLMDNAAKWSPATGTVRVSMEQLSSHEVRLRFDDSGPGIAPEEREKVFERFYRSAEARSMPGSGLGLAIVKSVIERHDGTIKIRESNDGGTRMEVILPGKPVPGEIFVDSLADPHEGLPGDKEDPSDRGEIFAQRWFNQG